MKTVLIATLAAVVGGAAVYWYFSQKPSTPPVPATCTCNCQHDAVTTEVPSSYTMG